jgi:hypothetical protein
MSSGKIAVGWAVLTPALHKTHPGAAGSRRCTAPVPDLEPALPQTDPAAFFALTDRIFAARTGSDGGETPEFLALLRAA